MRYKVLDRKTLTLSLKSPRLWQKRISKPFPLTLRLRACSRCRDRDRAIQNFPCTTLWFDRPASRVGCHELD